MSGHSDSGVYSYYLTKCRKKVRSECSKTWDSNLIQGLDFTMSSAFLVDTDLRACGVGSRSDEGVRGRVRACEGVQGRARACKGVQRRARVSNGEGSHTLPFFSKFVSQKMSQKSITYN